MSVDTQTIQAMRNKYIGQVGNRCYQNDTFSAPSKQFMSRVGQIARAALVNPQIVFAGYYIDSNGNEVALGATAQVTASIEYPAGVFTQVKFSGLATGVIPNGGQLLSDKTPLFIPKGKSYWVRFWTNSSAGIVFITPSSATSQKSNAIFGDGFVFGATTPDLTMSGSVASADNYWSTPLAVIGETRVPSFFVEGDSRDVGQAGTVDATGDTGQFKNIKNVYGSIHGSRSGASMTATLANGAQRLALAQYASHIILSLGINDILNLGLTAAQTEALLVTRAGQYKAAYPNKPVLIATIYPNTNAGNTAPAATNAARIAFNDWARAIPTPFDGCVELADGVEATRNGGLFTSSTYTADGLHMLAAGITAEGTSGFMDPTMFVFGG